MAVRAKLVANVGPMLSGKTLQALFQLERAHEQGLRTEFLKPDRDTRFGDAGVVRSQSRHVPQFDEFRARVVKKVDQAWEICHQAEVVILDEGQMFPPSIAPVLLRLVHEAGARVIFCGLDTTWRGQFWATTAAVMALPGVKIYRHAAVCAYCKGDADWTQKLRDGKPVSILDFNEPTFEIGSLETYQPACASCFFRTTPGAQEDLVTRMIIGKTDPATSWGESLP